jgi:hypothetical protein
VVEGEGSVWERIEGRLDTMGKISELATVDWRMVNGKTWHENAVRYFL